MTAVREKVQIGWYEPGRPPYIDPLHTICNHEHDNCEPVFVMRDRVLNKALTDAREEQG